MILYRLLFFWLQSAIKHGILQHDRHWSEKIFWLICCVLSWIGSGLLMNASWNDFQHNAISFVVDTNYLEWDTKFPSVSVCETDNPERLAFVTDKLFGDPHDYNLDEIVKELVYFRGLTYYTLQICGSDAPPNQYCSQHNVTTYIQMVRGVCSQIFRTCKWNGEEFDCCKYFVPVDTEFGLCYAVNSKQSRDVKAPHYPMISNKKTGPGTLYLEVYGNLNIYIHGEQEVPSITTLQTDLLHVSPHTHFHRYIAIKEVVNQPEVKDVSVQQRNCRYMDESDLDVYYSYSYSACCVQCRKNAQIEKCNCSHHFMPNLRKIQQCAISGLECLNKYYNDWAVLKTEWANRTGLVCQCLPSCTEIELSVIKDDKTGIQEDFAIVELTLERLPTERFTRNVVRGKLDLVVSMGGTTALFIGASILSFVEVAYYFLVRPIGSRYMNFRKRPAKK